jgi:hypothetical protein
MDCHVAMEKVSTTLLARLPLYPWHLLHLSIPLATGTEMFLKERMATATIASGAAFSVLNPLFQHSFDMLQIFTKFES